MRKAVALKEKMDKLTLLNIDCMEYMATLPDKAFDLALVDPPYGIGDFLMKTSAGIYKPKSECVRTYAGANTEWNKSIPNKNYFDLLYRISKEQIVWGANYYNCFSSKGGALVWYKNMGHKSLSQCEIASLSFQKKVDYFYYKPQGGFIKHEKRVHPCQKPVELYTYCLENYAKPGQRVLDTHLGSGSSAIAAHYFGVEFVGCEIDPDYYNAACKRIKEQTRQIRMF